MTHQVLHEIYVPSTIVSLVTKIFIVMDLEGMPGISDKLSGEFQFMNEEFTGHCDEQDDASEVPDDPTVLPLLT